MTRVVAGLSEIAILDSAVQEYTTRKNAHGSWDFAHGGGRTIPRTTCGQDFSGAAPRDCLIPPSDSIGIRLSGEGGNRARKFNVEGRRQ